MPTYFDISLTIGSTSSDLTWSYANIPAGHSTRDLLPVIFDQGTHNGGATVYTHLRVSIHRGEWRNCGSTGAGDTNDRTPALPTAGGDASYEAFCVEAETRSGGWHDPKIKIINKDGTGQYTDVSEPNCTCT